MKIVENRAVTQGEIGGGGQSCQGENYIDLLVYPTPPGDATGCIVCDCLSDDLRILPFPVFWLGGVPFVVMAEPGDGWSAKESLWCCDGGGTGEEAVLGPPFRVERPWEQHTQKNSSFQTVTRFPGLKGVLGVGKGERSEKKHWPERDENYPV